MQIKVVSSLEKCFLDEDMADKKEYSRGSMLKNEVFHFQICYSSSNKDKYNACAYYFTVESDIADYITVSRIEVVPVQLPVWNSSDKETFIRSEPGLYPDVIQPLEPNGRLLVTNYLKSLMVEVNTVGKVPAGQYQVTFCFTQDNEEKTQHRVTVELEIIDYELPEQKLIYTQWLHCDCLKDYYGTGTFDERHFEIVENFAKFAVRYGVNMMYTPVFTPPLDTYVGGERPTIQLVGVEKHGEEYSFDFSLMDKWIEMCERIGIKYFEISHLFTQWGAKAAPKIMAKVDGEYKKIFGWETDATDGEYVRFLQTFLKEFLVYMKSKNGADKRCYFHISDEPAKEHLESYLAAKAIVESELQGCPIMDALSNYEFYESGVSEHPIAMTTFAETFVEHGVQDLWAYYCGDQAVSNRFIAMPSSRNRILGVQLFKYNIIGFLHWGYNFYYNENSYAFVNPFLNTCGDYFTPSGDCFSVYPGPNGHPWASIRLLVFYDALQDIRALQLCEQLYGREFVMNIVEGEREPITFFKWPQGEEYLLDLREKINSAIKNFESNL